jgi:hypothetical protein
MHGQGTYTCANGKVFKGTWKNGEILGNLKWTILL